MSFAAAPLRAPNSEASLKAASNAVLEVCFNNPNFLVASIVTPALGLVDSESVP